MRWFIYLFLLTACGGSGRVSGTSGAAPTTPVVTTLSSATVTEGDLLEFTVTRPQAEDNAATFTWTTANGTAGAGDFTASSGSGVIPPGQTSTTISVPTTQDTTAESDETMQLVVTPVQNMPTGVVTTTGTIRNLDSFWDLTTALPAGATLTRGSAGNYYSSVGTLTSAAINAGRFDYDAETLDNLGLLMETARTNSIRNSTMVGGANGVIGGGGSLPTNWASAGVPAGISLERVGTGTENGMNYIDIRMNGTNTSGSTGFLSVYFETTTGVVAAQGEIWSLSFPAKLTAGSLPSTVEVRMVQYELTAAGGNLTLNEQNVYPTTTRAFLSYVLTLSNATTGRLRPGLRVRIPNGQVMDFTTRIYAPQLELGTFPSSRISTTGAATVTRSLDQLNLTVPNGTYSVRIVTPYVSYDQTNVVVAGGTGWDFAWPAAAVTDRQTQVKQVLFTTGSLPKNRQKLKYSPPAQTAPTVEYVTTSTFYGIYTDTQDVTVVLNKSIRLTQIQTQGGRHIRFIGGHLRPPTVPSGNFVLRSTDVTGSVFIEGLIVDATDASADAIVVSGKTGYFPDVYLQNTRVLGVNGTNAGVHADIFQNQADIGNIYVDKFTGVSNYQGFFIPPQFSISSANFNRTNLRFFFNGSHTTTFLFWLRDDCTQTAYPASFAQTYLEPRVAQDIAAEGVWPNTSQTGCAAAKVNSQAYWPAASRVTGTVLEGAPTTDFAPLGNIGPLYVSPGYE